MISEVSRRYAQALYDLTKTNGSTDRVFSQLRVLSEVYNKDAEVRDFLLNPIVGPEAKTKVLHAALNGKVTEELLNVLLLMADKVRLEFFPQVVLAFEEINDAAHGVTRGVVKSAAPVTPDERKRIEETVNKVTGKKVILTFQEDPSLLGGLVAQVGGWTFDDSLKSHLNKISEELNRRAN